MTNSFNNFNELTPSSMVDDIYNLKVYCDTLLQNQILNYPKFILDISIELLLQNSTTLVISPL